MVEMDTKQKIRYIANIDMIPPTVRNILTMFIDDQELVSLFPETAEKINNLIRNKVNDITRWIDIHYLADEHLRVKIEIDYIKQRNIHITSFAAKRPDGKMVGADFTTNGSIILGYDLTILSELGIHAAKKWIEKLTIKYGPELTEEKIRRAMKLQRCVVETTTWLNDSKECVYWRKHIKTHLENHSNIKNIEEYKVFRIIFK